MERPIRVVHIDDDPDFADLTATYLTRSREDILITSVQSGPEALELVQTDAVDCIVSDFDMPEMNGIELLQEIRTYRPNLPFILFTGKGSEEIASEAISAGVSDYLQKQAGTEQFELLGTRIENLVSRYWAEASLETRISQQRTLAEIGRCAIETSELDDFLSTVMELVADTVDTEFAKILRYRSSKNDLILHAGNGWQNELVGAATVRAGSDSQAGFTLRTEEPIVVDDLREEERFSAPQLLIDHDILSGISVVIGDPETPWGVLGIHSTEPRTFSEDDIAFVQTVAHLVTGHIGGLHEQQPEGKLFQKAAEATGHSIYWTDPNGIIQYVNPAFEQITGYSAEQAIGLTPRILKSGEHGRDFYEDLWSTIKSGNTWRNEITNRKASGERYVVDQTIAPVRDDSGDIRRFVAVNHDISALKAQEQRFEHLHQAAPAFYSAEDETATCLVAVDAISGILEHSHAGVWLSTEDDSCLKPVATADSEELDIDHPVYHAGNSISWEVYQTGEPQIFHGPRDENHVYNAETDIASEMIVPVGTHGVIKVGHTEPAQYSQNDCQYVELIAHHLSGALDLLAAREELTTKTRYLETILEYSARPMFMKDREGRYLFASQEYYRLFDLEPNEVIGRTDFDFHPEKIAAEVRRNDRKVLETTEPIEIEESIPTASGNRRTFLSSKVPIYLAAGPQPDAVFGTATDITERTHAAAKQQLLLKTAQLVGATDSFSDGLEQTVSAICQYTEWVYGEVWLPSADNGALELVGGYTQNQAVEEFLERSIDVTFEVGEGLPGRVFESAAPEWITDVIEVSPEVFARTDIAAAVDLRAAYGVPLLSDGDVLGVLTFFMREATDAAEPMLQDVSDVLLALDGLLARRQYEQRLEEQRDGLEVINELLRHDIRNHLMIIQGHTDLLQTIVPRQGDEHLDTIRGKSQNAISLTADARDLTNVILEGKSDLQPVELIDCLSEQLESVSSTFPHVTINFDTSDPEIPVLADSMLSAVFRNLFWNAIQHNDTAHPEIRIRTEASEHEVIVTISDNGPGIPDDRKDAIFGKGEKGIYSSGTGIGLFLVQQLIDRYDGEVRVDDNDPRGAMFTVSLQPGHCLP